MIMLKTTPTIDKYWNEFYQNWKLWKKKYITELKIANYFQLFTNQTFSAAFISFVQKFIEASVSDSQFKY